MGCWLGALGRLMILPEPDEKLIREFLDFMIQTCPKEYSEDEKFRNTWFFDEKNRLISGIGKFAEPSIWYEHLKENFFEKRGYELIGDPKIVGEGDLDIWLLGDARFEEYTKWEERVRKMREKDRYPDEPGWSVL